MLSSTLSHRGCVETLVAHGLRYLNGIDEVPAFSCQLYAESRTLGWGPHSLNQDECRFAIISMNMDVFIIQDSGARGILNAITHI